MKNFKTIVLLAGLAGSLNAADNTWKDTTLATGQFCIGGVESIIQVPLAALAAFSLRTALVEESWSRDAIRYSLRAGFNNKEIGKIVTEAVKSGTYTTGSIVDALRVDLNIPKFAVGIAAATLGTMGLFSFIHSQSLAGKLQEKNYTTTSIGLRSISIGTATAGLILGYCLFDYAPKIS
jgi:hypothetical protein